MNNTIGRLEPANLRDSWSNEAQHFTPWLAQAENLALLGEAVGLSLEPEDTEVAAGSYKADIVAGLPGSSDKVVIENQFGNTDHDHLGKLLTYAASLRATKVIWVAEKFTEGHRKTIEWLNQLSVTKLQLFAVEISLWRIGTSPAAPQFVVVSQPDDSARVLRDEQDPEPVGAPRLYLEFWTQFREHMESADSPLSFPTPGPRGWFPISIGRSGFGVNAMVSVQKGYVGCELYMSGPKANRAFSLLQRQKEDVETELGILERPLRWESLPEGNDCRIDVYMREDRVELERRKDWPSHFAWLKVHCESFAHVFRPLVKELDLTAGE